MTPNVNELDRQHTIRLTALKHDFPYFARTHIQIEGKNPGEVLLLKFNRAQEYLHEAVERMLKEVGYVRIIIVKGRQQGISTYIEMRLFHRALYFSNTKISIISHETKSTSALFNKAKFAHSKLPDHVRPELLASNKNELILPNGSNYMVTTAGETESGRSQTAHHQHQSERAFFSDPKAIDAGAGQVVADVKGTEKYKESTGNGINDFYFECMDSLAGKGDWRLVFIPWFWQPEYRKPPKPDFKPDEQEQDLINQYQLDYAQLQWRRDKIIELKSERLFRQEYPFTIQEAFQASGSSFYPADLVDKARKSSLTVKDYAIPLVIGVDPGRTGDRTVLTLRRGRIVTEIIKYDEMDSMRLAGIILNLIKKYDITKVFVDYGLGHGTIDRLRELGYSDICQGVYFSESPSDEIYLNKRAEMAFEFKEWLKDGNVKLPDDDDMAADIGCMPDFEQNSRGKIFFPDKEKIKEKYGRSPDILDSIMLTFAYPVRSQELSARFTSNTINTKGGSALSTLRRVRNFDNEGEEVEYEEKVLAPNHRWRTFD